MEWAGKGPTDEFRRQQEIARMPVIEALKAQGAVEVIEWDATAAAVAKPRADGLLAVLVAKLKGAEDAAPRSEGETVGLFSEKWRDTGRDGWQFRIKPLGLYRITKVTRKVATAQGTVYEYVLAALPAPPVPPQDIESQTRRFLGGQPDMDSRLAQLAAKQHPLAGEIAQQLDSSGDLTEALRDATERQASLTEATEAFLNGESSGENSGENSSDPDAPPLKRLAY